MLTQNDETIAQLLHADLNPQLTSVAETGNLGRRSNIIVCGNRPGKKFFCGCMMMWTKIVDPELKMERQILVPL